MADKGLQSGYDKWTSKNGTDALCSCTELKYPSPLVTGIGADCVFQCAVNWQSKESFFSTKIIHFRILHIFLGEWYVVSINCCELTRPCCIIMVIKGNKIICCSWQIVDIKSINLNPRPKYFWEIHEKMYFQRIF